MRDFSSTRPLSSDEVDKAIVETREKVSHHHRYHYPSCRVVNRVREIISVCSLLSLTTVEATANSCSSFSTLMNCYHHAIKTGILPIPVQC